MTEEAATAKSLVASFEAQLTARRDPAKAPTMAAYMRNQFAFLGVTSPGQNEGFRAAMEGTPRALPEPVVAEAALDLWQRPEREYQYVGCRLVNRHAASPTATAGFLGVVEQLLRQKSWWDTVDSLAIHALGDLVRRYPQLHATMDTWLRGNDLWLTRTALLHMNRWKAATDQEWLFAACLRCAGHHDFFIRKAIGWALRERSKTDEAAVVRFVADHADVLSGLSRREALMWIERRRRRTQHLPTD